MKQHLAAVLFTAMAILAGCEGTKSPGSGSGNSAEGELLFENTGKNCRNFLIIAPVTEENARKFVPPEFTLIQPNSGFVELADCESGTINGVEVGPFRIAEAAVFITPPDGSPVPPSAGNQAIYLLWQLDSNAQLSQLKRDAGFFGGVVAGIELNVGDDESNPLLKTGSADIPFEFSPYQMSAQMTPDSPPGPPLPNSLWHVGPNGVINTYNDVPAINDVLAGMGTITLEEGTALHELFGATSVTGAAASGVGNFFNSTRLRQDIAATKPAGAP